MVETNMVEGYWRTKYDPDLPMPESQPKPVSEEFLAKLKTVQALSHVECYRGWSNCRCCGKMNGNREYEFNGWSWPEGFEHYLVDHNVHPTPEFAAMVEAASVCKDG